MSPQVEPILPADLPTAQGLIVRLAGENKQLRWRVQQLEKELFGPSSEKADSVFSKEQVLLSLFPPPAEPPATDTPVVADPPAPPRHRPPLLPQAKTLETVTQRLEPEEKICPHCGEAKCEIGCERSERFEYVPARIIRHETLRPKLACSCGQGTVSVAPCRPRRWRRATPVPDSSRTLR